MFFSFPSLLFSDFLPSSLHSRPASFLSWCVNVTLESKTWVLSKECVFLCPIWAPLHPSLLESHILLQLSFPRTYHCFPTVGSLLAPLSITVLSQLVFLVFFLRQCQSHTFAITGLKALDCPCLGRCMPDLTWSVTCFSRLVLPESVCSHMSHNYKIEILKWISHSAKHFIFRFHGYI